ncbi:hypothetical protein NQ315_008865 [Exocentrus adspersus]|uniref:Uncharacterized protein n=1 Tax=Exocentrus adspersus TaxID=1586481 RepID=A0AAV8V8B7_9CUCU|nr:hypothetical protein NQ315_008865 [Exocentrus adspersus]
MSGVEGQNSNHNECAKYLSSLKFTSTPLKSSCIQLQKRCSQEEYLSAYRSVDGSCNHISDGLKGESFTAFTRYFNGTLTQREIIIVKTAYGRDKIMELAK